MGYFMLQLLMLTSEVWSLSIHSLISTCTTCLWNLNKIVWSELHNILNFLTKKGGKPVLTKRWHHFNAFKKVLNVLSWYVPSIFVFCSVDTESPIITTNIAIVSVITDPGLTTALAMWAEPTASDNSGVYTMTSSHDSGSSFAIGITTVTYIAVDGAENIATHSFNVSVKGKSRIAVDKSRLVWTLQTDKSDQFRVYLYKNSNIQFV